MQPCLGWLLFGTLAAVLPKRRGRVAIFGLSGQFADNSKYFFLHLASDAPAGTDVRYVSDDAGLTAKLRAHNLPVLPYPSLRGLWFLLRCEIVVADASSWVRPLRYQALWRARKAQLWHGCPIKRIELDDHRVSGPNRSRLLAISQRLIGRFPRYDLVLSPSRRFSEIAFRRAFNPRVLIEDDYPRNIVFRRQDPRFLIGIDSQSAARIRDGQRSGLRTVFYMPTFRDTGGDAISDGVLDLDGLERFALAHDVQLVVKLHPVAAARINLHGFSRIVGYDPRADIYPLLPVCDVLITDYSSVMFDFLHAERPLVFFPYDLEKYEAQDRSLYFDYQHLVPGPVCRTQDALERELALLLRGSGGDQHATRRSAVRSWAFVDGDGDPSSRIARAIFAAGACGSSVPLESIARSA